MYHLSSPCPSVTLLPSSGNNHNISLRGYFLFRLLNFWYVFLPLSFVSLVLYLSYWHLASQNPPKHSVLMASISPSIDLCHLPPTFLLPTHLSPEQALENETQLRSCGCPLVPSVFAASLFLADINTSKRAAFELRGRGIKTVSISSSSSKAPIRVVKLAWFTSSLAAGRLLPIDGYIVYTATRISAAPAPLVEAKPPQSKKAAADEELRKEILESARRDAVRNKEEDKRQGNDYLRFARHANGELVDLSVNQRRGIGEIMALSGAGEGGHRRASTPEFEDERQARPAGMPEWVKKKNVCIFVDFLRRDGLSSARILCSSGSMAPRFRCRSSRF